MGRNPQTGEPIKIPARKKVGFSVAKTFKESVLGQGEVGLPSWPAVGAVRRAAARSQPGRVGRRPALIGKGVPMTRQVTFSPWHSLCSAGAPRSSTGRTRTS